MTEEIFFPEEVVILLDGKKEETFLGVDIAHIMKVHDLSAEQIPEAGHSQEVHFTRLGKKSSVEVKPGYLFRHLPPTIRWNGVFLSEMPDTRPSGFFSHGQKVWAWWRAWHEAHVAFAHPKSLKVRFRFNVGAPQDGGLAIIVPTSSYEVWSHVGAGISA